jgi:hypothetical protein
MIQAKLSHTIDVNLSLPEAREIAIKYICTRFNWKTSYFIRLDKNNNEEWLFDKTIVYSSHSFESESRLRKASDTDKIVYQFLQEILNT